MNGAIGDMSSQNPKQNPSAIGKKRIQGTHKGDAGEYFRISAIVMLTTPHSPDHTNDDIGNKSSQNPKRPLQNPSAVGNKRMRGTYMLASTLIRERRHRQYIIPRPQEAPAEFLSHWQEEDAGAAREMLVSTSIYLSVQR